MEEFKKNLDDQSGPSAIRAEAERLFKHMNEHPVENCKLAIMMFGHEEDEGIHICTMMGGKPELLVKAVAKMTSKLIEQGPEVKALLMMELVKCHQDAMVERRAEELIKERAKKAEPDNTKLDGDTNSKDALKKLLADTFIKHGVTPPNAKPH